MVVKKKFKTYELAKKSLKGKKGFFSIEQMTRDKKGRFKIVKIK